MNVKVKAAIETAKTVLLITLAVLLIPVVINFMSVGAITFVLLLGCLCFGIKMIYDIKLSEAERNSITNIDQE